MNPEIQTVVGILIAALGGLAVGLERQWSGHATGPQARFAGVRTFTLLGMLAGIAGWMWTQQSQGLAALLISSSRTFRATSDARRFGKRIRAFLLKVYPPPRWR